ncbi:MAG: enoyl-CoA hydratase family protein [Acidobacteriota bacterium]
MSYSSFDYSVSDQVATVRLDRPDTLNSLTFEAYAELEKVFADVEHETSVRAVMLTGAGKGFCSGGSVTDIIAKLLELDIKDKYRFTRMTCNVVRNMRRLRKPIVAAVNGVAAGAGAMLALASDIRICAEEARFAFLFVKVGLAGTDMGAAWLLPRIVGAGRASELLFTGRSVDAREALAMGLANRVVPGHQLHTEAMSLARKLADGPALALGLTKELINNEASMPLEEALEAEAQAQCWLMETPEFHEGYRAFMEKRRPSFGKL